MIARRRFIALAVTGVAGTVAGAALGDAEAQAAPTVSAAQLWDVDTWRGRVGATLAATAPDGARVKLTIADVVVNPLSDKAYLATLRSGGRVLQTGLYGLGRMAPDGVFLVADGGRSASLIVDTRSAQ